MAINFDMVGKTTGPFNYPYTEKDMIIYALGVGAGPDELEYVYEKNLKVIPCFGAILAVDPELFKTSWDCGLDKAGSLHWGFDLQILGPIKTSGNFASYSHFAHIYDRGPTKGALSHVEVKTLDEDGNLVFINNCYCLGKLDGGFGGEKPPVDRIEYPNRAPDFSVEAHIAENQALIYRLSGDTFVLHVDPEFCKNIGYDRPILHGLCTAGFACRAIISTFIPHEPERLTRYKLRFTNVVYPGDNIRTDMWVMGDGVCHFKTINTETGASVLDYAVAEWKA